MCSALGKKCIYMILVKYTLKYSNIKLYHSKVTNESPCCLHTNLASYPWVKSYIVNQKSAPRKVWQKMLLREDPWLAAEKLPRTNTEAPLLFET